MKKVFTMKYVKYSFLVAALLLSIPVRARHDLSTDFAQWMEETAPTIKAPYYRPLGFADLASDEKMVIETRLKLHGEQLREILELKDNEYPNMTEPLDLGFRDYALFLPEHVFKHIREYTAAMIAESKNARLCEELERSCKAFETKLEEEFNLSSPWKENAWDLDYFESWFIQVDVYFEFVHNDADKALYYAALNELKQSVTILVKELGDIRIQASQKVLDLLQEHKDAIKQHIKEHSTQEETHLS